MSMPPVVLPSADSGGTRAPGGRHPGSRRTPHHCNRRAMDTGPDATDPAGREAGRHAAHFDAWLALTGQTRPPAGPVRLPMLSGSMSPALPCGCTLIIAPTPPATAGTAAAVARPDGRCRRPGPRRTPGGPPRAAARALARSDLAARDGRCQPARQLAAAGPGRRLRDRRHGGRRRALPSPGSRRLAARGLLRHLRGLLLSAPVAEEFHSTTASRTMNADDTHGPRIPPGPRRRPGRPDLPQPGLAAGWLRGSTARAQTRSRRRRSRSR